MDLDLQRLISNARARLGDQMLSKEQQEENARQQAIQQFRTYLAGKIDISTALRLFIRSEDLWHEGRPAVRFKVDKHFFLLARGDEECQLSEQRKGELFPLARLADSDPRFEDRLLVAIGSIVDPLRN